MKPKRKKAMLQGLLLAAASGNAAADLPFFSTVDNNRDGYISEEEAQRTAPQLSFAASDLDGDRHLDRAEYARAVGPSGRG